MSTIPVDSESWIGSTMIDSDGSKLGSIEEIYVDEQTNRPAWMTVKTGMLGNKPAFVPLAGASVSGDAIQVPYDKGLVKDAPKIEADGEVSADEVYELYRHYGLPYADAPGGDRGTVGHDVSGPETDDAMTRSEEELRIGTTQRESGRVRLVKHVVTEQVQTTVPVSREEVRIEREPISAANEDQAMSGGELTEEEHEVVLHEEEVVVEKRVVPKERVRMERETVTEERQVDETVRKEQIEAEGQRPRD